MFLPPTKPHPNHAKYLEVLRAMTPAQKFAKVCELTELSRQFLRAGLRQQFPIRLVLAGGVR